METVLFQSKELIHLHGVKMGEEAMSFCYVVGFDVVLFITGKGAFRI